MAVATRTKPLSEYWDPYPRYNRWLEAQHVPVYHEYFIEDLRKVELGPWEERECNAAIVVLAGQEGVTEARLTEIPPGESLPAFKFTLDEMIYVLEGRGLTSVWAEGKPVKTFEWQKHSLFVIPRGYHHRLSSVQGDQAARLLHFNSLPIVMAAIPDPSYFFNNPYVLPDPEILYPSSEDDMYSEAKLVNYGKQEKGLWISNFFPDVKAWDKMKPQAGRGGGASTASLAFPSTANRVGLPTMPVGLYKKAHRHGPGIVIVIPSGEGMSVMWPSGREDEKMFCMWHEGSVFVPPNQWWHQHFNVGPVPARYVTMHPPTHPLFGAKWWEHGSRGLDGQKNQIEYTEEDPAIRARFEAELAKRGLKSLMPPEVYTDPNYEFDYPEEE